MIDSSRPAFASSLDNAITRSLLEQVGAGALLYAFALPAIGFILWPMVSLQYLVPWATVLALTAIARGIIGAWAARKARDSIEVRKLGAITNGVLIVSSIAWGASSGFLLVISSPSYQMFLGVTLAGVASVTVLSITSAPAIARASVVLILLPLTVVTVFANPMSYTFAPFIAVWGAVLLVLAKRLHNNLRANLELEITNIQLLDELKEQSASLERSEAYFCALAERAQDIVLTLSKDGVIEYCRPSVERGLGYRAEELHGSRLHDYVHTDDISKLDCALSNAGEAREPDGLLVTRIRSRDGAWRYIGSSIRDLTQNPVISGIVINARDITTRRKAEAELVSANERFFQANPAMVAITSADGGELHSVNDRWTEVFGHSREEAIGKTAVELGIWFDPAERAGALETWSSNGSLNNFEARFRARDGAIIYGLHSAEPIEVDGQAMCLGQ